MLQKGHYNVKLDEEAWDRLYTWIDLNVPDHGTWTEHRAIPRNNVADYRQRRLEMRTKYANNPEDPEAIPPFDNTPVAFVPPAPEPARVAANVSAAGWPFDGEAARKLQLGAAGELSKLRPAAEAGATPSSRVVDLGNGVKMEFVLVPAGEYVMGSTSGARDEQPVTKVKIASPFWMSVTEVSNEQYRCYDPKHDSRFIDQQHKDHTTPGYPANLPKQPVIRVPWTAANQFCNWLSVKTGASVQLPTEAQWEWACRAGTATPFWYGDLDTDFGKVANLADQSIKLLAVNGVNPQPVANPHPIFQDFTPKDARFNDRNKIQGDVGTYEPNAWGLRDMHGNVCEWTRSTYRPYPYVDNDGRNDLTPDGLKVARGGSWYDRPFRATASWRLAYFSYQPVWDVGFRVILEDKGGKPAIALAR
jgi:formylglycine-generating enzyme required for sulfatase activity